jgi:hypothetical protein
MKVVYIAHPLGRDDDREKNRNNAMQWCAYLALKYKIAPVADWIVLSGVWDETPFLRKTGLEIDYALINRCDELWMVGGRITEGMKLEAEYAEIVGVKVKDMTHLGYKVNWDYLEVEK